MSFIHSFVLICSISALALAYTPTDYCSNDRPHPTAVRVDSCTQPPCHIAQGTTANMQIDFRAPYAAETLRPHVNATVFGLEVEFPLAPEFHDACQHFVNSRCPVEVNDDVTYNFRFEVTRYYPAVKVLVQLSLYDAAGNVHFCTRISVQVDKAEVV